MPLAARLSDLHTCPMVTGSVPHGGGPIVGPGEPQVLIDGMPAARVGDACVCVGPPDIIVGGEPSVVIGGQPAARIGDSTAHGGLVAGSGTSVLIGRSAAEATLTQAAEAGAPFVELPWPAGE